MGLLRTASRAAVASSVHGRVQRRQQSRWAERSNPAPAPVVQAAPPQAPAPPLAPLAAPPAPVDLAEQLNLLGQLGELKAAGVLTEEEFAMQKAAILARR